MKSNQLEELRKIHSEIENRAAMESDAKILENENFVLDAMKKVIKLGYIARREGLLALEEAVENIPLDSEEEKLKQLIFLIVDGTEAEIVEEIGFARYYASLCTDYEALVSFLYIEGALSIQAGENPRILEEKLKSMLPLNLYLKYSKEQEKKEFEKKRKSEENLIERLCKGERLWNPSESGYYVSKLVDYAICDITDKELQRVMREVDNVVLTLAMKGMSGEARKHIFDNLSERLALEIAKDMTSFSPVRAVDILEASQKILTVLIRLIDMGEIGGIYEYLEPFYQVVQIDTKVQRQKNNKIEQLKKLVEEYEQGAELMREFDENRE